MSDINLLKTAVLVDILDSELSSIPIERTLNPILKCRLKNIKTAANALINSFDELMLSKKEDPDKFGEICDIIKDKIDDFIDEN